jgi:predicted acyltransferase
MTSTTTGRLISLDAMRGFTIAAMILVNYPGSWDAVFEPLEHATWNGLTPTDLIFPFFLFIVGVSIALAYSKKMETDASRKDRYQKIIIRTIKIFAVGVFLSLYPHFDFSSIRIAGVLQRISIVFCCCAFLFLNTKPQTQAWIGGVSLVVYWILMRFVPAPGEDTALLEPGRNLAAWIDSRFLPGRMWQGTWDPEGILSTLPSIVTGICGLLAGALLLSRRSAEQKVIVLMVAGVAGSVAGYLWGLDFPVNKNLWSSSFVLVTAGFACLLLGTCYYIVDILNFTRGTKPGIIFGANAIAVYFLSDIFSPLFYSLSFGGSSLNAHFMNGLTAVGVPAKLSSVSYALLFVVFNFGVALFLYRKKIFIKL